jgi:hypothetical protein
MIDANSIVSHVLAAAATCDTKAAAADAVRPILTKLRADLSVARTDGPPPMLRAWSLPPVLADEGASVTAMRLRGRMDEIELARRFGDHSDVQRMLDITIAELSEAALIAARS